MRKSYLSRDYALTFPSDIEASKYEIFALRIGSHETHQVFRKIILNPKMSSAFDSEFPLLNL